MRVVEFRLIFVINSDLIYETTQVRTLCYCVFPEKKRKNTLLFLRNKCNQLQMLITNLRPIFKNTIIVPRSRRIQTICYVFFVVSSSLTYPYVFQSLRKQKNPAFHYSLLLEVRVVLSYHIRVVLVPYLESVF
jgi:hypothetical protein